MSSREPSWRSIARRELRRAEAIRAGACPGPWDRVPVPIGGVGLDGKAMCPACSRRAGVTSRGLFAHHLEAGRG